MAYACIKEGSMPRTLQSWNNTYQVAGSCRVSMVYHVYSAYISVIPCGTYWAYSCVAIALAMLARGLEYNMELSACK